MGDTRLRRDEKHWCWGCTSCVRCKADLVPMEINKVDNVATCEKCRKQIRIVKATVRLDGEEFTFE